MGVGLSGSEPKREQVSVSGTHGGALCQVTGPSWDIGRNGGGRRDRCAQHTVAARHRQRDRHRRDLSFVVIVWSAELAACRNAEARVQQRKRRVIWRLGCVALRIFSSSAIRTFTNKGF